MNEKIKKNFRSVLASAVCVPMLAAAFVAAPITVKDANAVTKSVGEGNVYYEIESKDHNEAVKMLNQAQTEVAREGMVLLKNEDNALPIAEGSKVTVFGNGQRKTIVRSNTSVTDSLSKAGLEVNPTVNQFYMSGSAPGRTYSPGNGHNVSGYQTFEAPVDSFTFTPESAEFTKYSDAAFVVISRIGGEGSDLPTRMAYNEGGNWGGFDDWNSDTPAPGARNADDHYLQLDQYETELLDYVCDNFEKVIVVINSFNAMELGFLDDPGHYAYHPEIKGALYMGGPAAGADAVGEIITGKVNPSGHLVDTYTRDFKKDPTWQNFSKNLETDGNRYTYGSSNTASNFYFVHYEEGIYVGYRYWETRGFDEGFDTPYDSADEGLNGTTTTLWDSWYDAHVVYPLGYGLSYTSFDWELVSQSPESGASLEKDGTVSATVKVTNTGTVAGKDVVQMYFTAPYEAGGIEKAHVVMSGFQKTKLLEPNESQEITVTMKVEDMKSYDYSDANENDIRGYELEAGDYEIKLCRNAHEAEFVLDYAVDEDIYYDTDSVTGHKVENLFDDVSFNENGVKQYMSRSDFEGTFPTSGTKYKQVTRTFIDSMKTPTVNAEFDEGKPWYSDEGVEFAEDASHSEIKLNHLIGRDYDDPLWDKFLSQMTREEMYSLPSRGFYETLALERLNKPGTHDCDGPWGWGGTNSDGHGLGSLCGPMISQTYNPDMAFLRGAMMAEAGYHGNRITGWYAPGMNIHRTPFSGRNNEYYSEDGYLSGVMAAAEIMGAKSKGMYSYAKHMFLNDQETNRDSGGTSGGLVTWANEQAMREIYAKPFELAVKLGDVQAVMSSFNRIGTTLAQYSWATLTGLLRNEWGFEGMVVTDWRGGCSENEINYMVRAGNDLLLGTGSNPTNTDAMNTPTHERAVYNAAKNILFTVCNSNAMNGVGFDWGSPVEPLSIGYTDQRVTLTKDAAVSGTAVATATAPGKTDGIVYEVVGGSLPQGLTLNADGTLTGTPTGASGLYEVQIKASDTTQKYAYSFKPAVATVSFVLQAEGESLAVQYTGGALEAGLCGSDYSASVATATVQSTAEVRMVYTLKEGSSLPAGLTMNSSGLIAGRAETPVKGHQFTVIASVAGNDTWIPTEAVFTIDITGRMYLNKRTINIYKETDFERLLDLFVADAGSPDAVFAVADGSSLPEGVTLDAATGRLSGKINTVGTYKFTVTVTADGFTQTQAEITVQVHEFKYVAE